MNRRGINTSILIKNGPTSAGNGRGITPPTPASSGLSPTGSAHAVPIGHPRGTGNTAASRRDHGPWCCLCRWPGCRLLGQPGRLTSELAGGRDLGTENGHWRP